MADEMNGEREALQRALGVIERWARDAYVVCSKPATQEGFEAAWKAEDADAYEVWSAGRASLAENAGSEPVAAIVALWEAIGYQGAHTASTGNLAPTEKLIAAVRDVEALIPHPSPPEGMAGWKLVPIEPTPAMLAAVVTSMDDFLLGKEAEKQYREDWAAMLDAAPPLASEAKDLP